MISIDTKRLHLRNVLQNDVDVIFDYRNNEICARYQRGQVKDYEGIVSLIEEELGQKITVVATGGLARKIIPHCKREILLDEDLLLKGLLIIYEKNKKEL